MSETKYIDRRHSATPDPDHEVETERQARRRAVREAAAKRDLELQPALLAEADVKASEARCDALADEHQRLCAPLQDELALLETRAIQRVGRREPPDVEEDARRVELAKLIADATSDLEKAVTAEHELQTDRRRTARRIRQGKPPAETLLLALAQPPLVDPKLLGEQFVLREKIKWLKARQNAAEKTLKICQLNATEIRKGTTSGDASLWQGKCEAWEGELAAVGSEIAEALAEGKALHQAMIDE